MLLVASSPTHTAEGESVERSTEALLHVCFRSDRQTTFGALATRECQTQWARLSVGWLSHQCCPLPIRRSRIILLKSQLFA